MPSSGSSTVLSLKDEKSIEVPSSTELMPSSAGAMSGVPSRIASTKFCRMPTCCGPLPLAGISIFHVSGVPNIDWAVLRNSFWPTVLRVQVIFPSSTTILPRSPQTSRRLVPGASPVVVTNTPVAPFGYSR